MQAKKFRVGVVGLGAWGFCLARHLALNGHDVIGWSRDEEIITTLKSGGDHPHLERSLRGLSIGLTSNISDVFQGVDCLVFLVEGRQLRIRRLARIGHRGRRDGQDHAAALL